MKKALRAALTLVILLPSTACTIVAPTDRTLIQNQAAVGVGVLADWDAKDSDGKPKMSDDDKKQAYWKSTRGYHRLNSTLFDVELPADFATDPWAKKTERAAAPVDGGK